MKTKIQNFIKAQLLTLIQWVIGDQLKQIGRIQQIAELCDTVNETVCEVKQSHDDLKHDFDQLDVPDKYDLRDLEENLEGQVKELEDKYEDYDRQFDRLSEKFDELNDEMEKVDTLKDKVEDLEEELETLKDGGTELETLVEALKKQHDELLEKVTKSSDEHLRKSMIDSLERLLFKLKLDSGE